MTITIDSLTIALELTRCEQADDPFGFRFMPQEYLLRSAGGRIQECSAAVGQRAARGDRGGAPSRTRSNGIAAHR